MFPTPESVIYYNEAGEVMGWDNGSYEPEYDPDAFLDYDEYDGPDDESEDDE